MALRYVGEGNTTIWNASQAQGQFVVKDIFSLRRPESDHSIPMLCTWRLEIVSLNLFGPEFSSLPRTMALRYEYRPGENIQLCISSH